MKKELVIFLLFLILIIPSILAVTTDVTVKTEKALYVGISAADREGNKIEHTSKFERTNSDGIVKFQLETPDIPIDITIKIQNVKNVILNSTIFKSHSPGLAIVWDLTIPLNSTEKNNSDENKTIENKTIGDNTLNDSENKNATINDSKDVTTDLIPVTGKSIEGNPNFSQTIYFIIGGILLIGIALFFGMKMMQSHNKRSKSLLPIKIIKLSDFQKKKHSSASQKDKIEIMEKKLKEAKNQIYNLKHHNQIREAQRKFEKAKRDLDKLKKN